MRPSRRFGFEQMGSHYDFTTRLLIAIDTSGSSPMATLLFLMFHHICVPNSFGSSTTKNLIKSITIPCVRQVASV